MKGKKNANIIFFISIFLIILIILPKPIIFGYESNDQIKITFDPRPNEPPMKPYNPLPANGSVDVKVPVTLSVDVYDETGDYLNVYFYNASNDELIGSKLNVSSKGSTASVLWNESIKGQICYWYAIAVDHMMYSNRSETWMFATRPNQPPIIHNNEYPPNGSIDIGLKPTCSIQISDEDEDNMTIYWYEKTSGEWVLRQINSSVPKGVYYWNFQQASDYSTTYYWKVSVNDSLHNTTEIFHFRTIDNQPVLISNPIPANETLNVSKNTQYFYITLQDPENDSINWTIETYPYIGNASGLSDISGQKACPLSGMNYIKNYTVYVNVTDSVNKTWVNKTFWFMTAQKGAPTIANEYPPHRNTKTELTPVCHLDAFDIEGDNLTIYWLENTTGAWILRQTDTNISANSTIYWTFTQASSYSTIYYWRVIVSDGFINTTATYYFTTEPAPPSPPSSGTGSGYTPPPNRHPIANITGPSRGYKNENLIFYAYYSIDYDGYIIAYRWDFDNDGVYDTDWLEDFIIEHAYSKIGNYTIRLQVKDNDGAISTASHNITIIGLVPPLQLPVVNINGPYFGYVNENILFTSNGSYDPDGFIINYTWDFGDGNISYIINPVHSYEKPGNYTVILKITDNDNLTNLSSTKVFIIQKEKIEELKERELPLLLPFLINMIIISTLIVIIVTKRKELRNLKEKIQRLEKKFTASFKRNQDKENELLGPESKDDDINTIVDEILKNKY